MTHSHHWGEGWSVLPMSVSEPTDIQDANPHWRRTLWAVWFSNFVTCTGLMAVIPYLTFFVEDLGITDPVRRNMWAGILVGAAPIPAALLGPIWGGLGDRFGRKAMVVRALLAVIVFVGLIGLAQNVWQVLVLRILQGCFAGFMPASITLVSLYAPVGQQGRISGLLQSAHPGGAAAGFLLGGVVSGYLETRYIFPICSALTFMGLIAILVFSREVKAERSARGSARSILRDIAADCRAVLGNPNLMRLLLGVIVVRGMVSTVDPQYARWVEEVGGAQLAAGLIMGTGALALLVFMPFWGRLSDHRNPSSVFALCSVGTAASFVAEAFAPSLIMLGVIHAFTGAFLAGVFPAAYAMAGREISQSRRGSAMGIVFLGLALSHALGATFGGVAVSAMGFPALFVTIAAATVVVGVIVQMTRPRPAAIGSGI